MKTVKRTRTMKSFLLFSLFLILTTVQANQEVANQEGLHKNDLVLVCHPENDAKASHTIRFPVGLFPKVDYDGKPSSRWSAPPPKPEDDSPPKNDEPSRKPLHKFQGPEPPAPPSPPTEASNRAVPNGGTKESLIVDATSRYAYCLLLPARNSSVHDIKTVESYCTPSSKSARPGKLLPDEVVKFSNHWKNGDKYDEVRVILNIQVTHQGLPPAMAAMLHNSWNQTGILPAFECALRKKIAIMTKQKSVALLLSETYQKTLPFETSSTINFRDESVSVTMQDPYKLLADIKQ
ncbi:hypothetical protein BGZ72_010729 [Mortierella alpina]|nr:hypothetical protein BGZ72_010729 [Mortierella alpina]